MGIRKGTWKKKVVSVQIFDGVAVMSEKTGVAGRLKQRITHIVIIHCVAHKLELVVLYSVKWYLVKLDDTLKTIFKICTTILYMYYYICKMYKIHSHCCAYGEFGMRK